MDSLVDFWPAIAFAIVTAAKFFNKKTAHWVEWPWYSKVLGLIVEVLDLWRVPELKGPKQ